MSKVTLKVTGLLLLFTKVEDNPAIAVGNYISALCIRNTLLDYTHQLKKTQVTSQSGF